jgi:apolipoprotein N-acyltransferase
MRVNSKIILAVTVGAAVAQVGYPPTGVWTVAVVVPAVLWALVLGRPPRAAAKLGFYYGLGFFTGLLYWLVHTLSTYGALPTVASASLLLLLCVYLALYPALCLACVAIASKKSANLGLFVAPLAWVGFEWVRAHLMTGFGWGDITQALWSERFALDLAPYIGVDGAMLAVALVMSGLAWLIARAKRGRRSRPTFHSLLPALLGVAVLVVVPRLPLSSEPVFTRVTVGIVQGNIDQAVKWDRRYRNDTLKTYLNHSEKLVRINSPDLLLWPETAMPFTVEDSSAEREALETFIRHLETPALFGAPSYERAGDSYRGRNSVYHIDGSGKIGGRYDKMHLVPFGEFIPFGEYFPFIKKLVVGVGDFTPGAELKRFTVSDKEVVVGPLICFESIFPDYATEHAERGAQLLALVTNDAWFGDSTAPAQHLAYAAWRAAETGLPLVRAANTGISAVFNHRGRLVAHTEMNVEKALYSEVGVPVCSSAVQANVAPFVGPLCLALALLPVFAMLRVRSREDEY